MKHYLALTLGLLMAADVGAAADPAVAFEAAVQKSFVQNALLGTWVGDCEVEGEAGASTLMEFSERADATVVVQGFSDSACEYASEAQSVIGKVALVGVSLDEYGQYVYRLEVKSAAGEVRAFFLNRSDDQLTVVDGVAAPQSVTLTRAQ